MPFLDFMFTLGNTFSVNLIYYILWNSICLNDEFLIWIFNKHMCYILIVININILKFIKHKIPWNCLSTTLHQSRSLFWCWSFQLEPMGALNSCDVTLFLEANHVRWGRRHLVVLASSISPAPFENHTKSSLYLF